MTDTYEDEDNFELSSNAAIKAKRKLINEGIPAAVDALIEVCRDKKAPQPARASAGNTILRAAGLFNNAAAELDDKPPEEMSAAEIAARLQILQLEREEIAQRQAEIERARTEEEDDGLFG